MDLAISNVSLSAASSLPGGTAGSVDPDVETKGSADMPARGNDASWGSRKGKKSKTFRQHHHNEVHC